uniref:Cystatin domain-containing protein n=1 Tax=Astatotilapia calliptera TaxID=8154 RepID=A0AAX7T1T4_ASTCA
MFVLWSLLFIYHLFPNPLTYVNQSTLYNSPVIVACSSLLCGTMRTLRVLTLLSAAVLLCSAAPGLEPLTCSEGNGPAAAEKANCTVLMTIKDGDADITKYECDTRQEKTNLEMVRICPDCPVLLPLNNSEGLKSVREATAEFNKNTSNQHYYILKEVGRISSGYIMGLGMNYYPEFALVETHCPMGSRIVIEACIPLCPNRARHAFCRSSYSSQNGLLSTECDFYPAENTTALGPGEKEPVCGRHPHGHGGPPPHAHDHGRGPPPHAHDHGHGPPPDAGKGGRPPHAHDHGRGPPPDAAKEGRPPHAHGPPPHADKGGRPPHAHDHGHGPPPTGGKGKGSFHPLRRFHPCHGFLVNPDPALHPICPWPLPHRPHN